MAIIDTKELTNESLDLLKGKSIWEMIIISEVIKTFIEADKKSMQQEADQMPKEEVKKMIKDFREGH